MNTFQINFFRSNANTQFLFPLDTSLSKTSANRIRFDKQSVSSNSVSEINFRMPAPLSPFNFTILPTMLASEKVLSIDWNSPEEDEAWQDL